MSEPFSLQDSGLFALTRDSLGTLRAALFRDAGADAATYLQEAGYAGGTALYRAFGQWTASRGLGAPDTLPASTFARAAGEFFRELGWGDVDIDARSSVMVIDSNNWAEGDPHRPLAFPGCHVSSGLFADFFGHIADDTLAVMEVECRSSGASRCRFLVGSPEVVQHVFSALENGTAYEDALEAL